jgi:hypothetical protein
VDQSRRWFTSRAAHVKARSAGTYPHSSEALRGPLPAPLRGLDAAQPTPRRPGLISIGPPTPGPRTLGPTRALLPDPPVGTAPLALHVYRAHHSLRAPIVRLMVCGTDVTTKEDLHRLVDELSPLDVEIARRGLAIAVGHATDDMESHLARLRVELAAHRGDRITVERRQVVRQLAADITVLAGKLADFGQVAPSMGDSAAELMRLATLLDQMLAARDDPAFGESVPDALLIALLTAPEDDEEETDQERAAVAEAREDIRVGRTRPWEDVRRELG